MAALLDVEQPVLPPSTSINFEELFNMELFALSAPAVPAGQAPEPQGDAASRGSSKSPVSSFLSLPDTTTDVSLDPAFFNFDLPNTFIKPADIGPSPSDGSPSSVSFDFFGSFPGAGSSSSPETAPSSATFSPPKSVFAIDPSLVGVHSPLPPPAAAPQQHFSEGGENSDEEDEDEDEPLLQPVKVGGRGKSARKGTVVGGVAKRTAAVKDKNAPDDDWRPTPEEYKKMSSKEKRQLRNKISARNFRVRRKEYISTLEGDIAERDRVIDAIREELGSTKLENVALRQEVDALKRAMLEGRSSPALPPPAPLTAASVNTAMPATSSNPHTPTPTTSTRRTARSSLAKPNTQKDLPASPRVSAARAFWGGSIGGAGGVTPVHATLIPDFPPTEAAQHRQQQENINPALNLPFFGGIGTTTPNPKFPLSPFQQAHLGANFDAFADLNPFTLKTLDAYRMQLWGRMAREAGASARTPQQQQLQQQQQQPFSTLSNALRPVYFKEPLKERDTNRHPSSSSSSSLSALLSGKSAGASSYPSPPPSPPTQRAAEIQPQHAMLAGLASQTLLSKMSSAFWDAFAGRASGVSPAATTGATGASAFSGNARLELDHDKVRRVLEGKAVVRVVDVDAPGSGADSLEESMRSLSIGSGSSNSNSNSNSDASSGGSSSGSGAGGLQEGANSNGSAASSSAANGSRGGGGSLFCSRGRRFCNF